MTTASSGQPGHGTCIRAALRPGASVARKPLGQMIEEQPDTLGDLPIHIISAGSFLAMPGVPAHSRPEMQRVWDALQERFTRLSSDAVRTVIAQSGHFVQRDRPEAVVAAVESIVAAQRRARAASKAAASEAS